MTVIYAKYGPDTVEVVGFRPGGDVVIQPLDGGPEFEVDEETLQEVDVRNE